MPQRPIFVATHPRACSTAFERIFMTRTDILECAHEPFGDAYYYGPERMTERYQAEDDATRHQSGFANTTYKHIMDEVTGIEGKRPFIKDMAYYFFPPLGAQASLAPSLCGGESNGSEDGNPTIVPLDLLRKFHFTFLIRHPRRSIPSFYRATVPPLVSKTGFESFLPSEAGYVELRRFFDYLQSQKIVGPGKAGEPNGVGEHANILVIDADDLLDKPAEVVEAFCKEVGIEYTPDMLRWEDEENQQYAQRKFAKWNGWHDDILDSTYLKPRSQQHSAAKKAVTVEEEDEEWREKYGEDGQKAIRASVDENLPHYEFLKQFALQV